MEALAAAAAAHVARAGGRPDEARRSLERALGLFSRLDFPSETALVRLELARTLADGSPELAVAEARSALASFERLGAAAMPTPPTRCSAPSARPGGPDPSGPGS